MPLKIRYWALLLSSIVLIACGKPADLEDRIVESDQIQDQPNMVLIMIDDLDFDELGTYYKHAEETQVDFYDYPTFTGAEKLGHGDKGGYNELIRPQTPYLDRLAANGVLFTRFYVTSPLCVPSRYSLMTGKYASRNVELREVSKRPSLENQILIGPNTPLDDEFVFAEGLKQAGYRTGFVGKWHNFAGDLHRQVPKLSDKGDIRSKDFTEKLVAYNDLYAENIRANSGFNFAGGVIGGNYGNMRLPDVLEHKSHNLEWITSEAEQFIDGANGKAPFFLYMSIPAPHGWLKHIGSDDDAKITPIGILDDIPKSGMPTRADIEDRFIRLNQDLVASKTQDIRELEKTVKVASGSEKQNFQRQLKTARTERNALLREIKRMAMSLWIDESVGAVVRKLEDEGILDETLIFILSDHQSRGKNTVYEGARVPAILHWPAKVKSPQIIDDIVANIDVAPTLYDVANLEDLDKYNFDGTSFLPVLDGEDIRDKLLLELGGSRAVLTDDWKYIANRLPNDIAKEMDYETANVDFYDRKIGWSVYARGENVVRNAIRGKGNLYFDDYFDARQLFDLKNDPYEQTNLFDDPAHRSKAKALAADLNALMVATDQKPFTMDLPD